MELIKNYLSIKNREETRIRGSQTVDKVPAKAGLFYIYHRFSGIIDYQKGGVFYDDEKCR